MKPEQQLLIEDEAERDRQDKLKALKIRRQPEMQDELLQRITLDPEICHDKPCIRGLRYPVEFILELLSSGMTYEEILGRVLKPKAKRELQQS